MNHHVIAILWTEQKVLLLNWGVNIVTEVTGRSETDLTPFPVSNWKRVTTHNVDGEEAREEKKKGKLRGAKGESWRTVVQKDGHSTDVPDSSRDYNGLSRISRDVTTDGPGKCWG